MSEVYEEALFANTHQALVYAFNYQNQQSPASPMGRAMTGPTGSGKGLSGVDGAAQAGFILAAVERLPRESRNVITARFGNVLHECKCCGQPTAGDNWRAAINTLSLCDDLRDLPRPVRLAAVQKALNLRKCEVSEVADSYEISDRTLRHKIKQVREKLFKLERKTLIQLDGFFSATGLIPSTEPAQNKNMLTPCRNAAKMGTN